MLRRAYVLRSQKSDVIGSEEELVIWIPAHLFKYAVQRGEFGSYIQDTVFKNGLWWPKQTVEGAAQQWVAIYDAADAQDREYFCSFLKLRVSSYFICCLPPLCSLWSILCSFN